MDMVDMLVQKGCEELVYKEMTTCMNNYQRTLMKTIWCHRSCSATYTSKYHINKHDSDQTDEPPPAKRTG